MENFSVFLVKKMDLEILAKIRLLMKLSELIGEVNEILETLVFIFVELMFKSK